MKLSSVLITLLGLAVAGGSAQIAREMMTAPRAEANVNAAVEMVSVITARTEIRFGQAIEAEFLTTQSWPREAVPAGAFTSLDQLIPSEGGEPRRARRSIAPGEIVMANKVSAFGEKVTIVQTLGANTRAVAIRVDAVTAVGGFVTPGDFVDIVLTQGGGDDLSAVTILQNVRVIGVDQDSNEYNDQPDVARTITVEVTPEDGQKLALAQRAGTLSLTLRTLDSVVDAPLDRVRISDLLQERSPVADEAVAQPVVRVRRAGVVAEETPVGN